MPELIEKNLVINDAMGNLNANKELLFALWNFFENFPGMAANFVIIDRSANIPLHTLQDNDYMVVRAIGEGPSGFQWEAKFQAADNHGAGASTYLDLPEPLKNGQIGLFIQLSPAGGWAIGDPTTGFGTNPTCLNQMGYNGLSGGPGHTCECFFWANGNRMMAIIDKDQDASYEDGWYLGKIEGVEAQADDPLPACLLLGMAKRGTPGGWSDQGWMLDVSNVSCAAILDPTAYINGTTQPSPFSGKYIQACIPCGINTAGSEAFRGHLDGVLAVAGLADKDTLASNYRICFNDCSFSWDGSIPV